jgi:hypothetical protein
MLHMLTSPQGHDLPFLAPRHHVCNAAKTGHSASSVSRRRDGAGDGAVERKMAAPDRRVRTATLRNSENAYALRRAIVRGTGQWRLNLKGSAKWRKLPICNWLPIETAPDRIPNAMRSGSSYTLEKMEPPMESGGVQGGANVRHGSLTASNKASHERNRDEPTRTQHTRS